MNYFVPEAMVNGSLVNSDDYISSLSEEYFRRGRREHDSFHCPECSQKLTLVDGGKNTVNYFRHHKEAINDCIYKTKGEFSGNKYIGEMREHAETKRFIAEKLRLRGENVKVEKTIRSHKCWKKPDIYLPEKKRALEIQKAWAGVDNIIGKEIFYRKLDICMLWIFSEVDGRRSNSTINDVMYGSSGARGVFLFTRENKEMSKGTDIYLTYRYKSFAGEIIEEVVSFDELDFTGELAKVKRVDEAENIISLLKNVLNKKTKVEKFVSDMILKISSGYKMSHKQVKSILNILYFNKELRQDQVKNIKLMYGLNINN